MATMSKPIPKPQVASRPAQRGTGMAPPSKPAGRPSAPGTSLTASPRALPGGQYKPQPGETIQNSGGMPAGEAPAAPRKPAWQVLREAGREGTGSAAGNRAAAAGLPGFGMEKPMPRPEINGGMSNVTGPGLTASMPPEVAGRIAQLVRERGGQPPLQNVAPPPPGVSEMPAGMPPGDEGAMGSGLPGFGPGGMSKPMMSPPAGGPPEAGGGSPFQNLAVAGLRARLGGLQGINGGGLMSGPVPPPEELPVPGGMGRPEMGAELYRDPRLLRRNAMGGF